MNESTRYEYIKIDKKGEVQILVPVVGGKSITLDNTCQSAQALKGFIKNIMTNINSYINDLNQDITILQTNQSNKLLETQKLHRLAQLEKYKLIVAELIKDRAMKDVAQQTYPNFPTGIKLSIRKPRQNFVSILLCPLNPDRFIRFDPYLCWFARGGEDNFASKLRTRIQIKSQTNIDVKNKLINDTLEAVNKAHINTDKEKFAFILALMNEKIKTLGPSIDLQYTTYTENGSRIKITFEYFESLYVDISNPKAIISGILDAAVSPNFWHTLSEQDHFVKIANLNIDPALKKEKFSIAIQFLIGCINIFYYEQKCDANFGQIIEQNPPLQENLIKALNLSFTKQQPIIETVFEFISSNKDKFKLSDKIKSGDIELIKTKFYADYATIEESPHFDEFGFLVNSPYDDKDFYFDNGNICISLKTFLTNHITANTTLAALYQRFYQDVISNPPELESRPANRVYDNFCQDFSNYEEDEGMCVNLRRRRLALTETDECLDDEDGSSTIAIPKRNGLTSQRRSSQSNSAPIKVPSIEFFDLHNRFDNFANGMRNNFLNYITSLTKELSTSIVGNSSNADIRIAELMNPHMQYQLTIEKRKQLKELADYNELLNQCSNNVNPNGGFLLSNFPVMLNEKLSNPEFVQLLQVTSGISKQFQEIYPVFNQLKSNVTLKIDDFTLHRHILEQHIPQEDRDRINVNAEIAQKINVLINNKLDYIINNYLDRTTMTLNYVDNYGYELINECYELLKQINSSEFTGPNQGCQEALKNSLFYTPIINLEDYQALETLLFNITVAAVHKDYAPKPSYVSTLSDQPLPKSIELDGIYFPFKNNVQLLLTEESEELAPNDVTENQKKLDLQGEHHTVPKDTFMNNGDILLSKKCSMLIDHNTKLVVIESYNQILDHIKANQKNLASTGLTCNIVASSGTEISVLNIGDTTADLVIQKSDGTFITVRISEVHNILHIRKREHYKLEEYKFSGTSVRDANGVNTCGIDISRDSSHITAIPPDVITFNISELINKIKKVDVNAHMTEYLSVNLLQKSDGIIADPDFICIFENSGPSRAGIQQVKLKEIIKASTNLVRPQQSIGLISSFAKEYFNMQKNDRTFCQYLCELSYAIKDDKTVYFSNIETPQVSILCDTHAITPQMTDHITSTVEDSGVTSDHSIIEKIDQYKQYGKEFNIQQALGNNTVLEIANRAQLSILIKLKVENIISRKPFNLRKENDDSFSIQITNSGYDDYIKSQQGMGGQSQDDESPWEVFRPYKLKYASNGLYLYHDGTCLTLYYNHLNNTNEQFIAGFEPISEKNLVVSQIELPAPVPVAPLIIQLVPPAPPPLVPREIPAPPPLVPQGIPAAVEGNAVEAEMPNSQRQQEESFEEHQPVALSPRQEGSSAASVVEVIREPEAQDAAHPNVAVQAQEIPESQRQQEESFAEHQPVALSPRQEELSADSSRADSSVIAPADNAQKRIPNKNSTWNTLKIISAVTAALLLLLTTLVLLSICFNVNVVPFITPMVKLLGGVVSALVPGVLGVGCLAFSIFSHYKGKNQNAIENNKMVLAK